MLASQLEDARRAEAEYEPLLLTTFRLELDPRGIREGYVEPTSFDRESLGRLCDLAWEVEEARDDLRAFLAYYAEEVETDGYLYTLDGDGELLARRIEPATTTRLHVFSAN